jgi:hypothetical protein
MWWERIQHQTKSTIIPKLSNPSQPYGFALPFPKYNEVVQGFEYSLLTTQLAHA